MCFSVKFAVHHHIVIEYRVHFDKRKAYILLRLGKHFTHRLKQQFFCTAYAEKSSFRAVYCFDIIVRYGYFIFWIDNGSADACRNCCVGIFFYKIRYAAVKNCRISRVVAYCSFGVVDNL